MSAFPPSRSSSPAAGGDRPFRALPDLSEPNPLEGLRVGICVTQDHERPTFVDTLTEKLRSRDALIRLMTEDEAAALAKVWDSIPEALDVLVQGRLTCNGYTDVFFDSALDCIGRQGRLTTVIERPSQGGRQFNLADTIVERLRLELVQNRSLDEGHRALGEPK